MTYEKSPVLCRRGMNRYTRQKRDHILGPILENPMVFGKLFRYNVISRKCNKGLILCVS